MASETQRPGARPRSSARRSPGMSGFRFLLLEPQLPDVPELEFCNHIQNALNVIAKLDRSDSAQCITEKQCLLPELSGLPDGQAKCQPVQIDACSYRSKVGR